MKKVLITGISGFAGSHLAEHLTSQKKFEITGTYLDEKSLSNLASIKNINPLQIDLMDAELVLEMVKSTKPDIIYHLAALTSPAQSFKDPGFTITNNVTAEINLLETVRIAGLENTKILITSSADVYGLVAKEDLPIDEDTPLHPVSPYAVSKIAQDFLGLQYFLSYHLNVIRLRPFNHIGPRQAPSFVVSTFAKKIAEIEKGKGEFGNILKVGNLAARRDFSDVRDVVLAYQLLMGKGVAGDVYNVGSGKSYEIAEILNKLISFSSVKIVVETDPSLFRPIDEPELVCDNTKLKKATGWKPTIPIDKSLKDTLDYWRNIL